MFGGTRGGFDGTRINWILPVLLNVCARKRNILHCMQTRIESSMSVVKGEYLSPAVSAPSFSSPGCGGDGSSKIFWIWYSSSLADSRRPALYTHRRKKRPLWYTVTNSLSCQCWRTSMDEKDYYELLHHLIHFRSSNFIIFLAVTYFLVFMRDLKVK